MQIILVVSNSADLHADVVIGILENRGNRVFRLNLDEFPRDYSLTLNYDGHSNTGELVHLPTDSRVSIADIGAVWMRKPAPFSYRDEDLGEQEKAFARLETDHTLFSMLYALECFWFSHPLSMRSAMWKGEQLARAVKFGFSIPKTIISNDPGSVLGLAAASASGLVYKAMSSPLLGAEDVEDDAIVVSGLETTLVTQEMLDDADAVKLIPCHFQEYIDKRYELRVTVVGSQVFAAKLYSQDDERTRVDSRNMAADIRYEKVNLDEELAAKCVNFVRSYGLEYGAIDLLVDKTGQVIFLENNPNGQFLYVQQLVPELDICGAVAASLEAGLAAQTRDKPGLSVCS